MDDEDFEISIQPSPKKKSTSKRNRKSKKASDSKVEKEKMVMPKEEWGDSVQELHLETINKSLNQINSNVSKNLSRISDNFEETNVHLWWLTIGIKISLFLMCFGIVCGLMFFAFAAGT
jgi:hypothetical protein